VPGNIDLIVLAVGFALVMLGNSLLEDHERRVVVPVTAVCALLSGAVVAWALNVFFYFARGTGQ
jgi:hypothetical protein